MSTPSSPISNLDPPFRGYIETTFDALLVFEAARRGMIPRVTRRLIERERGMVQSGAVFVFDEHESGIKRWTDGLVWSPSRILGNFLVYRETDKKATKGSGSPTQRSPTQRSPRDAFVNLVRPSSAAQQVDGQGEDAPPPLGQGALARPRSASDGGASIDRQKERQLVGSLTNSYKFKEGGLVKKVGGCGLRSPDVCVDHVGVNVIDGKLRTPATIPELASLEISPEYLHKQNFRFPPQVEVGADGIPRYRGEPEEPVSPITPTHNLSFQSFQHGPPSATREYYEMQNCVPQINTINSPRGPMSISLPSPHSMQGFSYMDPGSAGSVFYDPPGSANGVSFASRLVRQNSAGSVASNASAMRPGNGNGAARRYQPYGPTQGNNGNRDSTAPQQYQTAPQRRASGSDTQEYSPENYGKLKVSYIHSPSDPNGSYPNSNPVVIEPTMNSPTYPTYYTSWSSMPGSNTTSRLHPIRPPIPPGLSGIHGPPSSTGSGSNSEGQHSLVGQPPQRDWPHGHATWEMQGVPSPGYPPGLPIHPAHEDWRQNAGAMA
ncbi:uncharacterized protein L203_105342 [Cryptococcus depauperatus CBS 7841]|uniref:cAMP-independent regulatory protein n=1 Tax=Cryptococcus depauperatus CBS 7841 TaxID=1295531 RepID=A0AAJ8M3V3_9TREE